MANTRNNPTEAPGWAFPRRVRRYRLRRGSVADPRAAVSAPWGAAGGFEGAVGAQWPHVVPDQPNELIALTHLDDGQVQNEFWLRGTPTTAGRPFERRLWAVFAFDDGTDRMTNERVFTEASTPPPTPPPTPSPSPTAAGRTP